MIPTEQGSVPLHLRSGLRPSKEMNVPEVPLPTVTPSQEGVAVDEEQHVPVNPSGRFGDVVWAKLRFRPKPPWTWEDEQTGVVREFAYVILPDGAHITRPRLVWKRPEDEIYRIWPGAER